LWQALLVAGETTKHMESGRMGKAVEHLVAASCILASRAKLNVSTTLVDDEGVDLVFHRRDGTATLAVQVKARMSDSKRVEAGGFVAFVRQQTFRARSDLYMLFVPTDVAEGIFDFAWLVPSADFEAGAQVDKKRGRLRFAASMKPGSKDKWSAYRVERRELPGRILDVLEVLDTTT
jgi:hypothetical protein